MPSNTRYRKTVIEITTYDKYSYPKLEMNQNRRENKVICSICLSNKDNRRNCPICHKNCVTCKDRKNVKDIPKTRNPKRIEDANSKTIQTSQTDMSQGLNLLNEVLTVFQSKKQVESKSRTALLKDIGISTDSRRKSVNLSVSKIQQYSIVDGKKEYENGRFTIIDFYQPDSLRRPQASLELKHKSSSIPQMKMDELKNSLKEKTKSKDAIEEVNRMFANVKRNNESFEGTNRPLTRCGPRVLPVVKTRTCEQTNVESQKSHLNTNCKCCQTNNYYLSSGDSFVKPECCHHNFADGKKCDKCVYMLCCHYQKHSRQMQAGVTICDNCRNGDAYNCFDKASSLSVFEDSC